MNTKSRENYCKNIHSRIYRHFNNGLGEGDVKTHFLFEWNLLIDIALHRVCQALLHHDCTSYVCLQGCFQQQAAPHKRMPS